MARNFAPGTSDRADDDITPPSVYSIGCWFKTDASVADEEQLIQVQDKDVANHYFRLCVKVSATTPYLCTRARSGGGASTFFGTTEIVANTWYHGGASWVSSTERPLWLNGVNEATDTDAETPANLDSVTIGAAGDSSPGDYFDGDIAEVAIWDVELVAADWLALAAGASPLLVRPASLIRYWPMVGRNSPETELIIASELTLTNTTTAAHPRVHYPTRALITPAGAAAPPPTAVKDVIMGGIIPFER